MSQENVEIVRRLYENLTRAEALEAAGLRE